MIAIIDSGSTKSDWILLTQGKVEHSRFSTIGLNPNFVDFKMIAKELNKSVELNMLRDNITKIFFYGAGCSHLLAKKKIKDGLESFFAKAHIEVNEDLLAAAYAAYFGKPSVICIIGTGSNSCFFDGKKFRDDTPSLGYIIGDFGSGNHLGKHLLRAHFQKQLPNDISESFDLKFNLSREDVIQRIYHEPLPNKFLASFSKFIYEHRKAPVIQNMIYNSLHSFFVNQVLIYPESSTSEINFIGSISHFYEDILRDVARGLHLNVGHIVQKPIDRLVDYHRKHLI